MGNIKIKTVTLQEPARPEELEEKEKKTMIKESGVELESKKNSQQDWPSRGIVRENKKRADAHSRHYVQNNGTTKAVIYGEEVNYYNDEAKKWEEIDNELVEKDGYYENKKGKIKTEISKADKGKKVTLRLDKSMLSWEYKGKRNSTNEKAKTELKVDNSQKRRVKAVYENAEKGTDIEYSLSGNGIKENIIVKEKSGEYKYDFELKTSGLELRLSENGKKIELYKQTLAGGEVEFTIPSPYMYDAAGKKSKEVYYEIEGNKEQGYLFTVVADAAWINGNERVFPVTIDPQIVTDSSELIQIQVQRKQANSTTWENIDKEDALWTLKALKTAEEEYRTKITIKKSLMGILDKNIITANLILNPAEEFSATIKLASKTYDYNSANGLFVGDITNLFLQANGDCIIYLEAVTENKTIAFTTIQMYPKLEVEYFTSEEARPTKRTFSVAGIGVGELDVATGEFITQLGAVAAGNSVLGLPVTLVHKKSDENHFVGDNFRLNLNETFIKNTSINREATYIYTDEKGNKHGFKKFYYFFDTSNKKQYVAADNVRVDADGDLIYNDTEKAYVEYRSATGLQATTKVENLAGVKYLEQRSDELKQLEGQEQSYKSVLNEFVIVKVNSGTILYRLSRYMKNSTKFEEFFINTDTTGNMLLTESEVIKYKNLLMQISSIEDQKEEIVDQVTELNDQKAKLVETWYKKNIYPGEYESETVLKQRVSLEFQKRDLTNTLNAYSQICSWNINFNGTTEINLDPDVFLIPTDTQNVPSAEQVYALICQWNLCVRQLNELGDVSGDTYTGEIGEQVTKIEEQITKLNTQNVVLTEQIAFCQQQIGVLTQKSSTYKEEMLGYYKDYYNLVEKKEQLIRQTPVNFLTDGTFTKGYNESGNLVGIYDRYGNYTVVEYEEYIVGGTMGERIARLYDSLEHEVKFKYTPQNLLSSITDA
ncbi:MAG: hypothetical protein IJV85_05555, partial [Clostridia bacterium]|nr:hypothetical protein [Clostridia bacterium]